MPKRRRPQQPKQDRSRFLVEAVMEAAARVTRDDGWAKAKISRIAKVAGVSVGSLYRYFPGRDLLLSALIDHALAREAPAFDEALAAMQGPTLRDSVQAFVQSLVTDTRVTDPQLLRQLADVLETAGRTEKVRTVFDEICERFCVRLLELHPHLDPPTLRRRAHMAFWGIRGAVLARIRVDSQLDFAALTDEILWVIERLLCDPGPALPEKPNQAKQRRGSDEQGDA